jgi:PadR family transcriptional regulator PadR
MANRAEVPYGTLDLMVLKTLDTLGPQHGYGIARRIEQVAESSLELNQGTIYPALLRLEQRGWISSQWGASEPASIPSPAPAANSSPPKPRVGPAPSP